MDFEKHLGALERKVSSLEVDGQPARAVTLSRIYETSMDDLWDAVTNPERLPRWFAPVEGDFREGGRYQVKGNAGGTITSCQPPKDLSLTWEMGSAVSWVDIRLSREGAQTRLTLVHTAHLSDHWTQFGPGAVGIGWELGFLGLALHLTAPDTKIDEAQFAASPDGKAFIQGSGDGWAEADIAGGEEEKQACAAAERTRPFIPAVRRRRPDARL